MSSSWPIHLRPLGSATLLAETTGTISTNDFTEMGMLTFTHAGDDPSLRPDVTIRLIKAGGKAIYDNVRLKTSGGDVSADYTDWSAGYGVDLSNPNGDHDLGGVSNNKERVWGLNPP